MVTETRLLTLEQDGQDRAARLRDLGGRIGGLGWLDGAVTRTVLHIGSSGRSPLAVETARAVAAALRAYVPAAHLEVLDLAEPATERYGLPAITVVTDRDSVALGPKRLFDELRQRRLVLDHQDAHAAPTVGAAPGPRRGNNPILNAPLPQS